MKKRLSFLTGMLCLVFLNGAGQTKIGSDSAHHASERVADSRPKTKGFEIERTRLKQRRLIAEIEETTQSIKDYLRRGIDTLSMRRELIGIDHWDSLARAANHPDVVTIPSFRNVTTTARILTGLRTLMVRRKATLEKYADALDHYTYVLDSLRADSLLTSLPQDEPPATDDLVQRINTLTLLVQPVDSALARAALHVHTLLARASLQLKRADASLEHLGAVQNEISKATFSQEADYFWRMSGTPGEWNSVVEFSMLRARVVLLFYCAAHQTEIVIILVTLILCATYLFTLRRVLEEEKLLHANTAGQLVLRYPLLSAPVIVISLFQFILPDPPAILNFILWMTTALSLTVVFSHTVNGYWMRVWLAFLILFFVSGVLNLLLLVSVVERWAMLLLALGGSAVALTALLGNKHELRERRILYFIGLVLILQLASIAANLAGMYNLSKNLFTTGYSSLMIGILFLWTVRLINEGLGLSFHVYTLNDRRLFSINFEKVGTRTPYLLTAGLVVGWFILFARNFYVFKVISDPIKEWVLTPRTVGGYSFSVASILVFISIMGVAAVISRIVSFFASDRPRSRDGRAGIGSLLLLVRIGIMGMALFLALAAAGIPLDKVTVILGALSLGIGFGLQTLVNNLVSGLILAFERPVNVGDIVEVQGKVGVMKSIGFRSSRIGSWDGADVIVPNGDLLSGQLVNWSDNESSTRLELELGVAYGTNLRRVETLLNEILKKHEGIIDKPAPAVLFQGFDESAISVKILFWVTQYKDGSRVRSELIVSIDDAFRQQGIIMPFPQREVNVRKIAPTPEPPALA
ncbi:mechanosensitive ion channel family protein [Chryseolinea lacunae]|uniref:Mechanosensitive ion channel n=1 Tax=Chryseolinea lacunae TaxID=2801331 RepID=A0ABS1KMJ2_9BACT|nr:mechanosensitive ion channel domain-containing protein [Chryseolinea lacunae]MBL0740684.1 mechanosensitive ion channel [Chryseolinea lacunae]